SLIKSVRDKVESRRRKPTGLRLSTFLKENASEIAEHTRAAMQKLGVADHQELAGLLNDITAKLELEGDSPGTNTMRSASEYGERVKNHGETLSIVACECWRCIPCCEDQLFGSILILGLRFGKCPTSFLRS